MDWLATFADRCDECWPKMEVSCSISVAPIKRGDPCARFITIEFLISFMR